MKKLILWGFLLLLSPLFTACQQEEETVESAYVESLLPEPVYKFSRYGYSSVDVLECSFLKTPLDYLYASYMQQARMSLPAEYDQGYQYYREGEFGLKPAEEVAASSRMAAHRSAISQDLVRLIEATATLSGYPQAQPYAHRNRPATLGISGFVGQHIGDDNIYFVDERGVAVAEVFKNYIMGAIYLDKILNVHLDDSLYLDAALQRQHQNVELVEGHNYTALEHHLDLAYGYYQFWQPLSKADGILILKNSHYNIYTAFVQARTSLQYYRYSEVLQQIAIIRKELSKVAAIRIMNLLIGPNTLVNIDENPKYAFDFLGQAVGLIRSLPFTLRPDCTPYFTYEEAKQLETDLLQEEGLWAKERLLDGVDRIGSLKNIAHRVGKPFGIMVEQLNR